MQTPLGLPQKMHMVSIYSLLMKCFLQKNFLTFLASWGVTQIVQLALGHESPGPVEHKMVVSCGIEALVGI